MAGGCEDLDMDEKPYQLPSQEEIARFRPRLAKPNNPASPDPEDRWLLLGVIGYAVVWVLCWIF